VIQEHFSNIKREPIAITHPEIAAEWCHEKNCGFTPRHFSAGSHVKAWWRCSENPEHVWKAVIKNRTGKKKSGCRFCNLGETTDLRDFPIALRDFDKAKNVGVDPFYLTQRKKYFWKCPQAPDHQWVSQFSRQTGIRCPFCLNRQASSTNNLALVPELACEFHPTKNGKLKPEQIPVGSRVKVWWKCPAASDHVWQAEVGRRYTEGSGCPFCANKRVSKSNSLYVLNRALSKQFHPTKNGDATPKTVVATTGIDYWWQCPEEDCHVWAATPYNRHIEGTGCPFCVNQKLSITNCLATVAPDVAKEWDRKKNKGATPKTINAYTPERYWFKCGECGLSWRTQVQHRVRNGSGCPSCANRRGAIARSQNR